MSNVGVKNLRHGITLIVFLILWVGVFLGIFAGIFLLLGDYVVSSPAQVFFVVGKLGGWDIEYRHYQKNQRGIYTNIQMDGLDISEKGRQKRKILSVDHLDISLNLWESLLHGVPVFEHFYMDKGSLNPWWIKESQGGRPISVGYFLKMLNFEPNIQISNIETGDLHSLNLSWTSSLKEERVFSHQLWVKADLTNVPGEEISRRLPETMSMELTGTLSGDLTILKTLQMRGYLKVSNPESSEAWIVWNPSGEGGQYHLTLKSLDLSIFSYFKDEVPGSLFSIWDRQLNPSGKILNLSLSGEWEKGKVKINEVNGEFSGVGFNPVQNLPGLSHLQGTFNADALGGNLTLSGQGVVLSSPVLFASNWEPMALASEFHWKVFSSDKKSDPWIEIQMDSLNARFSHMVLTGQGKLNIPRDNFLSSKLELSSVLEGKNLTQGLINPYLPKRFIHQNLYEWLTHNLVSVASVKNTFQFSGKLNEAPFLHSQGVIQDIADIQGGDLIPWRAWPEFKNIQGHLFFDRTFFSAEVKEAQVLSNQLGPVHMEIQDFSPGKPSFFTIKGESNPSGEGLVEYILKSPLKDDLPLFNHLNVSGKVGLKLNLAFPLGKTSALEKDQVQGTLTFEKNQLEFKEIPLPMKDFTGKIHFEGFNFSALSPLTGQLLGKPWRMNLYPERIEIAGDFDFSTLSQAIPNPFFTYLAGEAPVSIKINFRKSLDIEFRSYLKMVQLNLPPPLLKPKGEAFPWRASLKEDWDSSGSLFLTGGFSLGALVHGQYEWKEADGLSIYALFHSYLWKHLDNPFNPYPNFSEFESFPYSPLKQKILIQGNLFEVDLGDWGMILRNSISTAGGSISLPIHTDINLSVNLLKIFSQNYSQVQWGLLAEKGQPAQMVFSGDSLKGKMILGSPIQAQFDFLKLKSSTGSEGLLSPANLQKIPSFWVNIEHLYWNEKEKGHLKFLSFPLETGIAIRNGYLNLPTAEVHFSGDYLLKDQKPLVKTSIEVHGTDFSQALKKLGFPSKINKTSGALLFTGEWNGGLTSIDTSSLSGVLGLELFNGTLINIESPAMSRLLGLFSIESLGKHLSLNFSDMKEKGFVFSRISGDYLIQNGVANTSDLLIEGPTLRVNLRGYIDLVNKNINQTVVALPNIDGGVALAASLIGGPAAGIMAWVADKVLVNTVLKGRGIVYQLKEEWK